MPRQKFQHASVIKKSSRGIVSHHPHWPLPPHAPEVIYTRTLFILRSFNRLTRLDDHVLPDHLLFASFLL